MSSNAAGQANPAPMAPRILPPIPNFGPPQAQRFVRKLLMLQEVRDKLRQPTPSDRETYNSLMLTVCHILRNNTTYKDPDVEGRKFAILLFRATPSRLGVDKMKEYVSYFVKIAKRRIAQLEWAKVYDMVIEMFFAGLLDCFRKCVWERLTSEIRSAEEKRAIAKLPPPFFTDDMAAVYMQCVVDMLKIGYGIGCGRDITLDECRTIFATITVANQWKEDPRVKINPIREGRRIGKLLWKHTEAVKSEPQRKFLVENFVWRQLHLEKIPLYESAWKTFADAAKAAGYTKVGLEA